MTKRNAGYRICAICGRRHGVTFGFRRTLKGLGIEGDKAVPICVIKALEKAEEQRIKGESYAKGTV